MSQRDSECLPLSADLLTQKRRVESVRAQQWVGAEAAHETRCGWQAAQQRTHQRSLAAGQRGGAAWRGRPAWRAGRRRRCEQRRQQRLARRPQRRRGATAHGIAIPPHDAARAVRNRPAEMHDPANITGVFTRTTQPERGQIVVAFLTGSGQVARPEGAGGGGAVDAAKTRRRSHASACIHATRPARYRDPTADSGG